MFKCRCLGLNFSHVVVKDHKSSLSVARSCALSNFACHYMYRIMTEDSMYHEKLRCTKEKEIRIRLGNCVRDEK